VKAGARLVGACEVRQLDWILAYARCMHACIVPIKAKRRDDVTVDQSEVRPSFQSGAATTYARSEVLKSFTRESRHEFPASEMEFCIHRGEWKRHSIFSPHISAG
jgi:hypothetical protein